MVPTTIIPLPDSSSPTAKLTPDQLPLVSDTPHPGGPLGLPAGAGFGDRYRWMVNSAGR